MSVRGTRRPPVSLEEALSRRRVVVCVGSGGVGKTTLAASLALKAAVDGRRTIVLTIDPARRLANALGLEELGNVKTRVEDAWIRRAGIEPKGELWAMMLDLKRSWDDFVERTVPRRPPGASCGTGSTRPSPRPSPARRSTSPRRSSTSSTPVATGT